MSTAESDDIDEGEYCREVEAYLCRKNDGHLIRLAGPSFSRVVGWVRQGIPLNAVYRGIDRYCERYYSNGPRRRPVHIDFCEADVLDVFDEWRRAVGAAGPTARARPDRHSSLPAHLERVITRLTTMRAGGRLSPDGHAAVDSAVREIDRLKGQAAHARGEHREEVLKRLDMLDADLLGVLRRSLADADWQAIGDEARAELARFKAGMPADAYERAVDVSATRLLRDRFGLPDIRYEEGA
ncbi:MAG: hypothetical protein ACM3NQ_17485 [Bacteroidales bacterium]